jgi:hypothetical protein
MSSGPEQTSLLEEDRIALALLEIRRAVLSNLLSETMKQQQDLIDKITQAECTSHVFDDEDNVHQCSSCHYKRQRTHS